jgi:sodium/pantothenate symporter
MDIYTTAIVISLVVYIAIGNYAGRRVKKLDDYFVAGRKAPTILIVGTLVASLISTNAFLGETGFVYEGQAGPYLLWPNIASTFYVYGALLFGRYLRRSRAITVADFFGRRFNSQRVQTAAGLTIIFGLAGYLLAVTQGAAYLLTQVVDVDFNIALVVAWASYTAFTMYSGSKGVILTDTLMFLLFSSVALVALFFLIHNAGGMSQAVYHLSSLPEKPDLMSWAGIVGDDFPFSSGLHFAFWNVTLALAWGMVYAVSPWQSSRYLIAKDEHVVMRAAVIAAISLALLEITLYFAGAVVNLTDSGITPPHRVMIYAAKNTLPALLGACLLAGIMAAALSSASTFLSLVGFSVSNDVFSHEAVGEQKMLRISRWTMLGTGIVVLMIAFVVPVDLFWLTYFVGTLFASSWGPVALMSVWSKRITADAAFWGIISGFLFGRRADGFTTGQSQPRRARLPHETSPHARVGTGSAEIKIYAPHTGHPGHLHFEFYGNLHGLVHHPLPAGDRHRRHGGNNPTLQRSRVVAGYRVFRLVDDSQVLWLNRIQEIRTKKKAKHEFRPCIHCTNVHFRLKRPFRLLRKSISDRHAT